MPDQVIGGIVGTVASGLMGDGGGSSPSISYTDPSKMILPESSYEAEMRGLLTNQGKTQLTQGAGLMQPAISTLQSLASGVIPQSFRDAWTGSIMGDITKTVGSAYNNLVKRGVADSTSMDRALYDVGQDVAAKSANNFGQVAGLAQGALSAGQGLMQLPLSLYNQWGNWRTGNRADAVVNPGEPGLMAAIAPTIGDALGSMIGNWFK